MGIFNRGGGKGSTASNGAAGDLKRINTDVLVNSIVDGVALIDAGGVVKIFNPAASAIMGWEMKDAIGLDHKSVFKFFDDKGQEYDGDQSPISQGFTTGKAVKSDSIILRNRSGNNVELDLNVNPILSAKGKQVAAMVIFRDVSKQRSEERQRADFISTASHEMRTPVAAIEGYLGLALNEKVSKIDTNARSYLEKAHASTQHLGKLFQDLLTAAKSEDGRLTSHPVVIEVGAFLREISENNKFSAEKKGLAVKYKSAENSFIDTTKTGAKIIEPIYYVHADPDRMREVVTNLFDNAVKYTDEGEIILAMTAKNNNVIISISDTGNGISKEDIPHLFQKFYRIDNSDTRQIGGTGLGLFICKKIVELYGGKIWADSEVGQGSTFYISLPQVPADKARNMIKQESSNKLPLDGRPLEPSSTVLPQQDSEPMEEMISAPVPSVAVDVTQTPSTPKVSPPPQQPESTASKPPAAQSPTKTTPPAPRPAPAKPAQVPVRPPAPSTRNAAVTPKPPAKNVNSTNNSPR